MTGEPHESERRLHLGAIPEQATLIDEHGAAGGGPLRRNTVWERKDPFHAADRLPPLRPARNET